jgi:hypothetical protein
MTLKIIDCNPVTSLVLNLPALRELYIHNCNSLTTIRLVGAKNDSTKHSTMEVVEISACCPMLVIISRKVVELRFVRSDEQVQLIVENPIHRLKVIQCPNFRNHRSSAPINNITYTDDFDMGLGEEEDESDDEDDEDDD